jgi:malate dehydrogenase
VLTAQNRDERFKFLLGQDDRPPETSKIPIVRSVVIVGAGELGGALARQVAAADITSQVTLVDDAGTVAEGKALDIRQAAPVDGYTTHLVGSTDESAVVGANAIVIADRAASNAEWQDDAGVALVRRLAYLNPSAVILCAGAHQLALVERGVREAGLDRLRLFGSAPEALRSAVVSMTALEAGCAPVDVSLTVVGRPPRQSIVPWEDASIAGRHATGVLAPPAITRLDGRLTRMWPPGPLTLASAATRILSAAARRNHHTVCAFVAVTREEGDRGRVGMLPVQLDDRGIAAVLTPTLSARDRVRLDTALGTSFTTDRAIRR